MRIAYIHQYFKTPEEGGAIRSYYLANVLKDAGHSVVMITSHNKPSVQIREIDGIQVHYLPVKYDNEMGILQRLMAFWHFYKLAFTQVKILADLDLIYATSTPLSVGMLALRIKRKLSIPYYFEVRDLWPDAPIEMGILQSKLLGRLAHRLESKIYRNADHVVALSKTMAQRIRLRAPSSAISVIPNISNTEFFLPADTLNATRNFTVAYFGAIGRVNGLESMLLIANACQNADLNITFKVFGTGARESFLQEEAGTKGLNNITFYGMLDKYQLRDELRYVDAAFISFADFQILETSSPNKFFDAIAAGKMIITNTGGWIREMVEEEKLGFYYNREDPTDFIMQVSTYVTNKEKLAKAQVNARKLAEDEFSIEILGQKLVALFKETEGATLQKLA